VISRDTVCRWGGLWLHPARQGHHPSHRPIGLLPRRHHHRHQPRRTHPAQP